MIRRKAFTLVELAVVVALCAVAAAVLIGVIRQPHRSIHRSRELETFVQYDRSVRRIARRQGVACRLVYDMDAGVLSSTGASSAERLLVPRALGHGVRLARIETSDGASYRDGKVTIPIDRWGGSPTYAVEVDWPGGGTARLLFAGVTGGVVELKGKGEWRAIFEGLRAQRDYVD